MKAKRHAAIALLLPLAAATAEAHGPRQGHARVVSFEPVYETVIV